jgi:hypothetical protein
MAFESYVPNRHKTSNKPIVRISKRGILQISPVLVEKHFKDVEQVQLLFDAETRRMAVKPAGADDALGLKLRKPVRASSCHVSASGFLEHFGLKVSSSRIWEDAQWDESLGALVIQW